MSYMTTATGKHFYPMNPNQQDIDLEDIAHALSLICRANGHFRHFYSVAQHSIACAEEAIARGYAWEVILGCLLHDARREEGAAAVSRCGGSIAKRHPGTLYRKGVNPGRAQTSL